MNTVLYIDAEREGYSPDQCRQTMTVIELIEFLEQFDDDMPIYLRHDRGYTYGAICENRFVESEYEED